MVVKKEVMFGLLCSLSLVASESSESRAVRFQQSTPPESHHGTEDNSAAGSPEVSYIRKSPRNEVTAQHVINILFGAQLHEPDSEVITALAMRLNHSEPEVITALASSNLAEKTEAAAEIFYSGLHDFHDKTLRIQDSGKRDLVDLHESNQKEISAFHKKIGYACLAIIVCWCGLIPAAYFGTEAL